MQDSGLLARAVRSIGSPAAEGTAERILDAALKQFELVGVQRTTVEDITRRSGLSRVTLYRHFGSKNDITEAVLLRELATFLADLEAKARDYSEVQDKLVEGFVFAHNEIREHRLLNRLLATEPETVLPFLTTDGSNMVSAASTFLAHQLSVTLPDDPRTLAELLEVAEVTVRIILSLVLTPPQYIALDDDDAARDFARRYLVPPLLGLSSDQAKRKGRGTRR